MVQRKIIFDLLGQGIIKLIEFSSQSPNEESYKLAFKVQREISGIKYIKCDNLPNYWEKKR